jgi:hypothetical protein
VAVVGESSGEYLGDALSSVSKGFSGFEVVSCGKSAASLEQIATRFEQVRRAKPDAVVIVLGHNLEKKYPDDRLAVGLQSWIARSRLLSLVAGGGGRSSQGNVPVLDRLVEIRGDVATGRHVAHVRCEGLSFAHGNWTMPAEGQSFPQAEVNLGGSIVASRDRGRLSVCVPPATALKTVGRKRLETEEDKDVRVAASVLLRRVAGMGVRTGADGKRLLTARGKSSLLMPPACVEVQIPKRRVA